MMIPLTREELNTLLCAATHGPCAWDNESVELNRVLDVMEEFLKALDSHEGTAVLAKPHTDRSVMKGLVGLFLTEADRAWLRDILTYSIVTGAVELDGVLDWMEEVMGAERTQLYLTNVVPRILNQTAMTAMRSELCRTAAAQRSSDSAS